MTAGHPFIYIIVDVNANAKISHQRLSEQLVTYLRMSRMALVILPLVIRAGAPVSL